MTDVAKNKIQDYIIPPQPQPYLPIKDTNKVFPVHRIYCVGRNYAAHAIEMGHDPDHEPPFFFQKNPDNLIINDADFPYPPQTNEVHHEIELVAALHIGGKNIKQQDALNHVYGYAVGLDMTRRDLQGEAKKKGRPWEVGKSFEHSLPCGELTPASEIGHPYEGEITLKVNGELRQQGNLNQMIWKLPQVIAILSKLFELKPCDIIMTGTPAGVGSINRGNFLYGCIDKISPLRTIIR